MISPRTNLHVANETRAGGRVALSDAEKKLRGQRVRELRLALGFGTQESLAEAAGIERTYVNRVENGGNALTSAELQRSFADAMGLQVEALAQYLDGKLPLDEAVLRRRGASFKDMSARLFLRWVQSAPAIKTVAARDDVSVLDLLRYNAAGPLRGGHANVSEVLARIEQLRHGDGVPSSGVEVEPHDAESQMRRKAKRSS